MSNETEPILGNFHDAITGKTVTRELTADEIAAITEATDEAPSPA